MSWSRNCPNCMDMWVKPFSLNFCSSGDLCIAVDTTLGLTFTFCTKYFSQKLVFCVKFYLAWLMLKLIAVCRSSHSPHFDGRSSPVSTIGAGSPIHCRRISQIVTFPIQPTDVVESPAIHNLAFANLYRFLLQLEPNILLIFSDFCTCLVECASVLSNPVLYK